MTPDRIEKIIHLKAPLNRVWQAISDSSQFGTWFGVAFDGPFVAGECVRGRIVPTKVDPEIAKLQEAFAGRRFEFLVEHIEPMRQITFRWHPFAVEPDFDYSNEPMTCIVFTLAEVPGGVLLTIEESGFENIPLHRRAKAFEANDGGWTKQTELIAKYLDGFAASL